MNKSKIIATIMIGLSIFCLQNLVMDLGYGPTTVQYWLSVGVVVFGVIGAATI